MTAPTFKSDNLAGASFENEQERFDAYAASLSISFPPGFFDKKGEKGDSITPTKESFAIPEGASLVDCKSSVEGAIVQLVSPLGSPGIFIKGINGSIVYLSGAASDGTLKLLITRFR